MVKNRPIILTDNNRFIKENRKAEDENSDNVFINTYKESDSNSLITKFNDVHISELCKKEHSSLLVFPDDIKGKEDDPVLFNATPTPEDPKYYRFKTDNLMGFVGVAPEKKPSQYLVIKSRFSYPRKNIDNKIKDQSNIYNDYFLQYLLMKVFNFNIFKDLDFTKDPRTQAFDWLMMMFPHFLKKAYAQGLYRTYKTFKHNDANVRGTLDVPRHLRKNIPFQGRVAYNIREYTRDNPLMQLVRHTIEYINRHKTGKEILSSDNETREAVDVIRQYTTYMPNDIVQVISLNSRPVTHPFYTAYADLQNICLKILRHERIGYGNNNDTVFGMIFDGAWLWEEYLDTMLHGLGYIHPQNKLRINGMPLFANNSSLEHTLYPDFYSDTSKIILDAKYKDFDRRLNEPEWDSGIREDVFQVISYMHIKGFKKGGFIFPCRESVMEEKTYPLVTDGESIFTVPFCIPIGSYDWKTFCESMTTEEKRFKKLITDL